MGKEIGDFSWRVIDQVQKAIIRAGMTDAEVIRRAGMPRSTFYVKMRGETPLNTEDVAKIATAIGVDFFEIMMKAAKEYDQANAARKAELDAGEK